jgi:hypothetical protein
MCDLQTLAFDSDESMIGIMIPVIVITGGLFLGFVHMICKTVRKSAEVKHKEESRREIAAYVAEGSMSPDDAYKLLSAGTDPKKSGCC